MWGIFFLKVGEYIIFFFLKVIKMDFFVFFGYLIVKNRNIMIDKFYIFKYNIIKCIVFFY